MGRVRRVGRWLAKALAWSVGGIVGLVVLLLLVLISPWGNEQIRAEVEAAAQPSFPGGALVIGGLDTNLFGGLALEDVAIQDKEGKTLIGFERFELGWQLGGLIDEKLVVDTVRLDKPVVDLTVLEDGTLDIQKVLGPPKPDEPSEPWTGLPIDVEVPHIQIVDGSVSVGGATTPVHIDPLGLDLGVALQGPSVHVDHMDLMVGMTAPYALEISTEGEVVFTGADVVIPALALHVGETILRVDGRVGAVQTAPVLDLGLRLDPLAPSTLEIVAGEPVLKQPATYEARLTGPLAALELDSTLASEGLGALDLDLALGLEADPMTWEVRIAPEAFKVDGLAVAVPVPVTLDGVYEVQGSGVEWPSDIQAEIDIDGGDQILGGESVAGLRLKAALDKGVLRIDRFAARHAVANLDLSGTADLIRSRASIDLKVDVPRMGGLSAYGAAGLGGKAGFQGHVDAVWEPVVQAVVDGDLYIENLSASGSRVQRGDGTVHVEVQGDDVTGEGELRLSGISASGAAVRSVGIKFSGGQSAKGDVHVEAGLEIDHVAMEGGVFEMDGLDGTLRARVPARGELVARADLDVQTFKLNNGAYTVEGGPITFEAQGDKVEAIIDLRREDSPFLAGRIDGDLATGQWSISGFQFAIKADDGLVAKQDLSFTLGEDGADSVLVEIGNPGGRGHIRLEGRASATDPDLHLQVTKVNLAYVMEMVHEWMGVGDSASAPEGGSPPQPVAEEEDDFAPVFPGDKGEPGPPPQPDPAAARTEQEIPADDSLMLGGLASLDLRVKKEGDAIIAEGWVELEDLVVPEQLDGASMRLGLNVGAEQAQLDLRVSAGDELLLYGQGQVPLTQADGAVGLACQGDLDVRTTVPALKLEKLAKRVPALAGVAGRVSMDLRVKGEACNPDLNLVAATDMPVGSQGERARIDLEFQRVGDKVVLKTSLEENQKRMVRVDSELQTHLTEVIRALQEGRSDVAVDDPNTWLESFDASVVLEAVPLEEVARLTEVTHPLKGILGGGFNIRGTVDNPEIRAGLVLVNGRIGEVDIEQGTMELAPSGDGYRLSSDLVFEGDGALGIRGFLPLSLPDLDLTREGLDITLSGSGVPLALAAGPGGISDAKGLLTLEGGVQGTLEAPVPVLALRAEDAGFTMAATGLRYDPVEIDIGFTPERLDLRRFDIRTRQLWAIKPRDGTLSLKGAVDMENGELTNVDVVAEMKEFWLSSIKLATLAVSGRLEVAGVYPDLSIVGDLAADEARFEVGESDLAESSGLEMDPAIVVHREKVEVVKVAVVEEGPSITDNFDVKLKLDLQQKVGLKADVPLSSDFGKQFSQLAAFTMDLGLDGVLEINSDRGELEVAGEVKPTRGFLEVLGKRFELQEGRITFTGANYTNPMLDLMASHQVGQYGAVEIKISGDVDQTAIGFTSPDYPDQTDVMSMLLFGKPTSAMSETEGESGSGLLSAALSTMGGQAARSSGAAFLQNVSVDPGSGSVKVGFPLSDKVYLAIERLQPESETDNMTQASVEWILSRRTYAEIITGDRGKSSGDLYWRWRF